MKVIALVGAVLVVNAAVAALWAASRRAESARAVPHRVESEPVHATTPRLVMSADSVSFGTCFDDEAPTVTFTIHNISDEVVRVERVDPSCGCGKVKETPASLAPGDEAEVAIQIRLSGMSGAFSKTVKVVSDDPVRPVATVRLDGFVRPRFDVSPRDATLTPASHGEGATAVVEVQTLEGGRAADVSAVSTVPTVHVSIEPTSERTAQVRIVAPPFVEDFRGAVLIRVGRSERAVSFRGVALRDVRADPPVLSLGLVRAQDRAVVRFAGRENLDWAVASVETSREDLTATVDENSRELLVSVSDEAPEGVFSGTVTVSLRGAVPDHVVVPVTAFVSKGAQ